METSNVNGRQKRKLAYRSRHRLLSIDRDSKYLKDRVLSAIANSDDSTLPNHDDCNHWPWLPNKQCGSWYLPPHNNEFNGTISTETATTKTEVYFKSTDGHVGTYAISLKRLNLQLLELLHEYKGCFLVDSSVRKILPDSFSRTIPIWCCVMNRIILKYRKDLGLCKTDGDGDGDGDGWDTRLYTPASIVSTEEHLEISKLIDSRVELLYRSGAIVDPQRLVRVLTKPVRAIWIANGSLQSSTGSEDTACGRYNSSSFFAIVCCNPSHYFEGSSSKNHVYWVDCQGNGDNSSEGSSPRGYYYTPGAADDDATWGRSLTHSLFWANHEKLLDPARTDGETDALIDSIVNEWRSQQNDGGAESQSTMNVNKIGNINLWIGSRRAGRPPECWDNFDCVLNVTENAYPNMSETIKDRNGLQHNKKCYYLQLPVEEGKRDKTELERWMPVGLVFLIKHLQQDRRILVHCAQGRDRSVAIVMAFVALFCPPLFPLTVRTEFGNLLTELTELKENEDLYHESGLSSSLVDSLLREGGVDLFLGWMHEQLNAPTNKPFANKESLRIVLHLVRQDRENAEPTRSTMQKLNRVFMSSSLYRSLN